MHRDADRQRYGPIAMVAATIILGSCLRFWIAATIGMGVDESYATAVAWPLSASYFDHPGLSFWIPAIVMRITGSGNALLLRTPFILCFALTTWLTYRVGARLFGAWAGAYAALLLDMAPVFAVPVGAWVLPDGPLDLFLVVAVLCLSPILVDDTRRPLWWWTAAGAATAVAMLSKYQAVFLPAGAALFLATQPRARRWWKTPGPYIAAAIAALGAVPTLWWNAQHAWASFAFQLGRGGPRSGLHPAALFENIGGQAAYLLPWLWAPLVVVLVSGLRRGPRDPASWLLCCLAILPIAFFTLISVNGNPGLPHWPMPGYLMLFPLLGAAVARRVERGDTGTRRWLWASGASFVVVLALFWSQAVTGWISAALPALFRRGDPTFEVLDWTDVRPALASLGVPSPGGPFVAATSWIDAGKLSHALGPGTVVMCLCGNAHQFGYRYDQRDFLGRDAILLDETRGVSGIPARYAPYFERIDSLPSIVVRRGGRPALTIRAFYARDFRRPFPSEPASTDDRS